MLIDPVVIGDYASEHELEVVASILDAERIEHDATTPGPSVLVKGRGGSVRVSRADLDRAVAAIAQYQDAGADSGPPTWMPEPGWRRFVLTVGGMLLLLYYLIPYLLDWVRWYQRP